MIGIKVHSSKKGASKVMFTNEAIQITLKFDEGYESAYQN